MQDLHMNQAPDRMSSQPGEEGGRASRAPKGSIEMQGEWFLRLVRWAAILAIGVLSLIPGRMRPETGMSGHVEHVIAYFSAAFALGLGARELRQVGWIAVSVTGYAGMLEILQAWVPGRHSQLSDFATSTTGIMFGCVVVAAFFVSNRRRHESLYTRLLRIITRRPRTSRDD